MRTFATGATRDDDDYKLDYEGFLSPIVLECFAEYMHIHRTQPDGTMRDSDNWQKGMPRCTFIKSLWRHFMDLWLIHRGFSERARDDVKTALCGIIFNAMGYLYEVLLDRDVGED